MVVLAFHTNFHSSPANLHPHQDCIRAPFLYHILASICCCFLMIAILTRATWKLRVALICISLIAKDV
jgi:hypothetical protein